MKTRRILFIGLLILFGNLVIGQEKCSCENIPIPDMHVKKNIVKRRDKVFYNRKKELLNNYTGTLYPVKEFNKLLSLVTASGSSFNGLRIYYCENNDNTNFFDSTLSYIFSPTVDSASYRKDSDDYYRWDGNTFIKISKEIARKLANHYQSSSLKTNNLDYINYAGILNGKIFGHRLHAYSDSYSPKIKSYSDTKCISYGNNLLKQLLAEFTCQQPILKMIGLEFSSSARRKIKQKDKRNRLIIHIKMMKEDPDYPSESNHYVTYSIEDDKKCYKARVKYTKYVNSLKLKSLEASAYDTGTPCPPGDGGGSCPGATLTQ